VNFKHRHKKIFESEFFSGIGQNGQMVFKIEFSGVDLKRRFKLDLQYGTGTD
jgi:hypothetical protein